MANDEELNNFKYLRNSVAKENTGKSRLQNKNKLIEARNRALVEQAIKQNRIFKNIDELLKNQEYSCVKIDMEQMVDAYMEISGPISLTDSFSINDTLVNEVISGIIYSISKEENGVVLKVNGEIDEEASMTQRMLAQYSFVSGIDELNRTQREQLLNSVEAIVGVEVISGEELKFYQGMIRGNLTAEDRYNHFKETYSKREETIVNSIKDIRQSNFIETKDELAFVMIGAKYDGLNSEGKRETEQQLLLLRVPERYRDKVKNAETGEFDINKALEVGRNWKQEYVDRKRKQAFSDYYDKRKSGKAFSELLHEDRNNILRAAMCAFEDKNASKETRRIAEAILSDIKPGLLKCEVTDGRINSMIDYENFIKFYNSMRDGKNVERIEDIRAAYKKEEEKMTIDKLEKLSLIEDKEWELSVDKEKKRAKEQNSDISNIPDGLRHIKLSHKKYSLVIDPQKKLDNRIENALKSSRNNRKTSQLSDEEKVNTIIASYKTLRSSITIGNLDLKNLQLNRQSYDMLEKYILSNPEKFGNFIDEVNGNGFVSESKIKSQIDLNEYNDTSSNKYREMQAVLGAVRKSTKKEEVSRDNIELLAITLKDSAKFLIKGGLNLAIGEKRAKQVTDAVKANKIYSTTRDATYGFLKGVHQARKAITRPITNLFSNNRTLGPGHDTETLIGEKQEEMKSTTIEDSQANLQHEVDDSSKRIVNLMRDDTQKAKRKRLARVARTIKKNKTETEQEEVEMQNGDVTPRKESDNPWAVDAVYVSRIEQVGMKAAENKEVIEPKKAAPTIEEI